MLDRVRRMSDVDFELEKEKLAMELKPANKIEYLHKQIERCSPYQRRPKISKPGRYFLSDRIIPILEERLAAD